MNCAACRDILMTDYLDNELSVNDRHLMDAHLATCPACRALRDRCMARAVTPFRTAVPATPPAHLWESIEASLRAERPHTSGMMAARFRPFALPAAMAAAALLMILAYASLRRPATPGENGEAISSYIYTVASTQDDGGHNFGSTMEQYLAL